MTPVRFDSRSRSSPPSVCVVTSHGRQVLAARGDERLMDVLQRNGVPWSAVSIYLVPSSGEEPFVSSCLDVFLNEFEDVSEVLVYLNRNVNPFLFSLDKFRIAESSNPGSATTEYFYQRFDNERSRSDVLLKKLNPDECKSIVASQVAETVRNVLPRGSDLVIGVSGGGDSNALLYSLREIRDYEITLHPTIIKGIPDWDSGVPRARALCESYGLELKVIEEREVKALLGLRSNAESLVDRFERVFTGDDFEFLGTLLVRLALTKRARELGTSFVCTGLNLEDVVCENLFRISSGMKPASSPSRVIGETTLILPLWMCPKRIIDGCFPKYSLENYEARYPCVSLGRNLYYSVVYAMQSQFPGFLEQFARGMAELAESDPVTYSLDEQLGFYVERTIPISLRWKFQKMLGRQVSC